MQSAYQLKLSETVVKCHHRALTDLHNLKWNIFLTQRRRVWIPDHRFLYIYYKLQCLDVCPSLPPPWSSQLDPNLVATDL